MVELGFDPKINIMWLKFGTRVPYGVNIHQKKPPSIGKLFYPFWGTFVPTPGKSVRGLKNDFFNVIYIGHIIYQSIALKKLYRGLVNGYSRFLLLSRDI